MICLNETFLDEGVGDNQFWLGSYELVSRMDRRHGRGGGGILFTNETLATILHPDAHVHRSRWLRDSSSTSIEGTFLFRFSFQGCFKQLVKQLTRGDNYVVISDESKSYDKLQTIAWFPLRPPSALQNVWRCEFFFRVSESRLGNKSERSLLLIGHRWNAHV